MTTLYVLANGQTRLELDLTTGQSRFDSILELVRYNRGHHDTLAGSLECAARALVRALIIDMVQQQFPDDDHEGYLTGQALADTITRGTGVPFNALQALGAVADLILAVEMNDLLPNGLVEAFQGK